MPPTFRRLAPLMDLVPYTHAPRLGELLGRGRWLLDVGGGTGRVAKLVRDRFDRVLVLDVEPNMLKRARARGMDAVVADARHLPVRDGRADGIVIVDAFHHFPDPDAVLSEAGRALGPGGRLVLEEFDPRSLGGRVVKAVEGLARFGSTFFPPADLAERAERAGLSARVERFNRRDYAIVATPARSNR